MRTYINTYTHAHARIRKRTIRQESKIWTCSKLFKHPSRYLQHVSQAARRRKLHMTSDPHHHIRRQMRFIGRHVSIACAQSEQKYRHQ